MFLKLVAAIEIYNNGELIEESPFCFVTKTTSYDNEKCHFDAFEVAVLRLQEYLKIGSD